MVAENEIEILRLRLFIRIFNLTKSIVNIDFNRHGNELEEEAEEREEN